jgi:AAA domain/TrwC relaxase
VLRPPRRRRPPAPWRGWFLLRRLPPPDEPRAGPPAPPHVVTANLAKGADGRYSRLDGRALYSHAKAAGYLYEAHLRHAVREHLPWVRWTEPVKGIAEIEGVPAEVLREFSQRRQEITEWLAERGADPGDRTAAERAALNTRRPKQAAIETAPWREAARARAAEHGLGREELEALTREEPPALRRVDHRALADELAGPTGLTERRSTFRELDALIEFCGADRDGSARAEVEARARQFLGRRDVVVLTDPAEPLYTTTELLRREEAILAGAERRRGERGAGLRPDAVERALDSFLVPLSTEQRAAALSVATSSDGVVAIEALAGTGKTTLAGALARAYERSGHRVMGAAPTARAARELCERAGIEDSGTLARLRSRLVSEPDFGCGRTVLIVDEAGMAETRAAAAVLTACEAAGVKVVAIGDPGQLSSVQAGGWFGSLVRRYGSARLTEVVRQRDPVERRALALVHDGAPRCYLELKERRGELRVHADASEAETELVERWWQQAEELPEGEAVMIARRNDLRESLNELARDRLRSEGMLGDSIEVAGREFAVGDRVIARRNDAGHDLDNGMRGTVREVDRGSGELVVETDAAGIRRLPAAYVHEHLEHAYALTGHGMQGATVEWAGVIGQPEDFTRNWSYTALTRAREPTELRIVATEAPRESERAEIAPAERFHRPEPLERLERSMRTPDEQVLARDYLDPPPLPTGQVRGPRLVPQEAGAESAAPLTARSDAELRAELRPLEAEAREQRRLVRQLNAARQEAQRAQEAVTEARQRVAKREERRGWWRRDREPSRLATARVGLETWQRRASAATECVRALEGELERSGANGPLAEARRERADAIRSELDLRREAQIEAALAEPRDYVTEALEKGPARPGSGGLGSAGCGRSRTIGSTMRSGIATRLGPSLGTAERSPIGSGRSRRSRRRDTSWDGGSRSDRSL